MNGPCRDELGIDYRAGCMGGAGGRGSMTIGRAVALCLRNIGGQRAGETTKTVFGQPARFGFCFGEWEERSPWPSLAERRGFTADEDVVTVHGGKGTFPIADIHNDDARDLLYLIAKSIAYPAREHVPRQRGNGEVVVAINPMWAERFGAAFPDVDDLQQYLREHAWQPIDLWPEANREILRDRDRVDGDGRVHLVEPARPDRAGRVRRARQPARDRVAELRREPDAEHSPVVRGAAMIDRRSVSPRRSTRSAGILRADGADLLLVDANPKTARVHLRLVLDDVGVRRVRPPARRAPRDDQRPRSQRRIAGEFELVLDDPRRV